MDKQPPVYPNAETRRRRLLAAGVAAFALSASGCGQIGETTAGVPLPPSEDAGYDAGYDAGPISTEGVAAPPDGGPIYCPTDAGVIEAPGGAAPLPDAGDFIGGEAPLPDAGE